MQNSNEILKEENIYKLMIMYLNRFLFKNKQNKEDIEKLK